MNSGVPKHVIVADVISRPVGIDLSSEIFVDNPKSPKRRSERRQAHTVEGSSTTARTYVPILKSPEKPFMKILSHFMSRCIMCFE